MKRSVLLPLTFLLLSGCSSSGDGPAVETVDTPSSGSSFSASPSPSPSPTPSPSAQESARLYIEALASTDATEVAQMVSLAEPGTVAQRYGAHRAALTEADRAAGGGALSGAVITEEGGGFEVCDAAAPDDCLVFADFEAVASGKLVSFTIDGKSIESRLLGPGKKAPVTAGKVRMNLLSAYRSVQTGALTVTVDVANKSDGEITVATYEAAYVTSDGRQSMTSGQIGLTDLQAGASAPVAITFDAADVGGTMTVEVYRSSDFAEVGTFKIPIE